MLMGPKVPFLGGPPEAACGLEPLCTAAAPLLCPQGWEEPSAEGGADISVPPPPASTSPPVGDLGFCFALREPIS